MRFTRHVYVSSSRVGCIELARDPAQPVVARATALSELRAEITPVSTEAVRQGLSHEDPTMRAAAVMPWRPSIPTHPL